MRKAGLMTIGKTHPRLLNAYQSGYIGSNDSNQIIEEVNRLPATGEYSLADIQKLSILFLRVLRIFPGVPIRVGTSAISISLQ